MSKNTSKSTASSNRDAHANNSNLDSRYGSIGIPAVAAALQFKRDLKNPVCAPASSMRDEDKHPDMAA